MIDVSELVNDPDNSQPFTILRNQGKWLNGSWQSGNQQQLAGFGVITPLTARDIKMVPEGDVNESLRAFYTATQIFTTNANAAVDSTGGSSDVLVWRGQQYRVIGVKHYEDYGYYKAIGTAIDPD